MPRSVLTSLSCQMRLDQKTIDDDNESLMTLLIRVFLYLSAVHYKYLRIRLVLYFLKPWNPALSSNAIIIVRSWPASLSQQNHPRLVESLLWHNCHSVGLGNNRLFGQQQIAANQLALSSSPLSLAGSLLSWSLLTPTVSQFITGRIRHHHHCDSINSDEQQISI